MGVAKSFPLKQTELDWNDMEKAASPAGAIWFYDERGTRSQGKSEAELIALIRQKTLTADDLVWTKGFSGWIPLHQTALAAHLDVDAPPPVDGARVNNTIVWFLAFAPIIGYLAEWFIAGMLNGSEARTAAAMADARYWYVTLILNIGLSLLDEQRLVKAGHSTRDFRGFRWLVPVYLFQRAKALKHSLAYFTVWLVCFGLVLIA